MTNLSRWAAVSWVFALLAAGGAAEPEAKSARIFDGKSWEGWEIREGEEKWWKIREGSIVGGSMEEKVPYNTFLATRKRYRNFELKLKVRLKQGEGFINSGIQVRSERVAGNSEMRGYQVDAGIGWWGKLYDESRRNRVIGEPKDAAALAKVTKDWDWNEYTIRCEGKRIRTWINGVEALDYTEAEAGIEEEGLIGLQAHGGGKFEVEFRDLELKELPAPEGAAAEGEEWEKELASFRVPEGYEIELVASDREGVNKPITVAWDAAGRMWTMTAQEYPVDANENPAAAEKLFASRGRDRVLVFDEPWKPGPQEPRVFAEGLAIPLGLLPWGKGAVVQHGKEIRYYEDADGDGRADGHQVLLEGFGIQDSHLFPHQFERTPGGWFYLAQGLFNASVVKREGGKPFDDGVTEVPFHQCKLARAKLDGSRFEALTGGPNNIWGLVTARDGEEYLQEANDIGHPVSELWVGGHYPSSPSNRLVSYAPIQPPSTPGQPMGGTGLSGLALAEDERSPFAAKWPGKKVFYVANPITNRIQVVTLKKDAEGVPEYRKEEDFLISNDSRFRPIAVHFGPDGAMYVVDWFNRIISHNEVPRNHPERDKVSGRIWRIKAKGQVLGPMKDLTKMTLEELSGALGHSNERVARLAWQELGDRKNPKAVPGLESMARNEGLRLETRLGALWALREMGAVSGGLCRELAKSPQRAVRREAIEAAAEIRGSAVLLETLIGAMSGDAGFDEKVAMVTAVRRQVEPGAKLLGALQRWVSTEPEGEGWKTYETRFLRYSIRWAWETHRGKLEQVWPGLEGEGRMLAALAMEPRDGALALVRELGEGRPGRELNGEEVALLGGQLQQPAVSEHFGRMLGDKNKRLGVMRGLLKVDAAAATNPALRRGLASAVKEVDATEPGSLSLVMTLARKFRLKEAMPGLLEKSRRVSDPALLAELLRTFREVGGVGSGVFRAHLEHRDPGVAREALAGYAATGGREAMKWVGERWAKIPGSDRLMAMNAFLRDRDGALRVAAAMGKGAFPGVDGAVYERLGVLLGQDSPEFRGLVEASGGQLRPVLAFGEKAGESVPLGKVLRGAFTLESWVYLEPGIDNRDGLLGRRGGGADVNFYDRRLRFYDGRRDLAVADRPVDEKRWFHAAVVRDGEGKVTLYLDGEMVGKSAEGFTGDLDGFEAGRANREGGLAGKLMEYRVWDGARSAEQIRDSYRTAMKAGGDGPWLVLPGEASLSGGEKGVPVVWSAETPEVWDEEASRLLAARFAKYRKLAEDGGDAVKGRQVAESACLICHPIRGAGGAIGPELGGAGAMGVEGLLRNILTPNAQLESGYYRHDLTLADGSQLSGFLVSEDDVRLVVRPLGGDERVVERKDLKEHRVSRRSLMPEGLLDGMSEEQVRDLFAYLKTLR